MTCVTLSSFTSGIYQVERHNPVDAPKYSYIPDRAETILQKLVHVLWCFLSPLQRTQMITFVPKYDVLTTVHIYYSTCLLYTSPSPRDATLSRMPSSA